jgi:hypothetical protein
LLDKEASEWAPGDLGRFHGASIDGIGPRVKAAFEELLLLHRRPLLGSPQGSVWTLRVTPVLAVAGGAKPV